MLAGQSGVQALTDDWAERLPCKIAAPAAAEPTTLIDRVQARKLDRCEMFALIAAREAWADAGTPDVDPLRLGVAVASGIGGISSTLQAYDTLKEKGWSRLSPFTVPMLMPNGSAGWLSIELGARAGVHTPVSACASGAEAIGYGIDMIKNGRADIVVAGGTEAAIIELNIAAFAAMRALSLRNDEPERASRPFDKGRDGFVLGEGAGIVVLESEEHAAARGARVYAVAAGSGYSCDAHHIAQPDPEGSGRGAGHPAGAGERRGSSRPDHPCQRACHLHPGRRCARSAGHCGRAWRRGRRRGRIVDQVDDRPPAWWRRGGRVRGGDSRAA